MKRILLSLLIRAANPGLMSPSTSGDEVAELKRRVKKLEEAVGALQAVSVKYFFSTTGLRNEHGLKGLSLLQYYSLYVSVPGGVMYDVRHGETLAMRCSRLYPMSSRVGVGFYWRTDECCCNVLLLCLNLGLSDIDIYNSPSTARFFSRNESLATQASRHPLLLPLPQPLPLHPRLPRLLWRLQLLWLLLPTGAGLAPQRMQSAARCKLKTVRFSGECCRNMPPPRPFPFLLRHTWGEISVWKTTLYGYRARRWRGGILCSREAGRTRVGVREGRGTFFF